MNLDKLFKYAGIVWALGVVVWVAAVVAIVWVVCHFVVKFW